MTKVIIDLLSLLKLLINPSKSDAKKAIIKKLARSIVTNIFLLSGPKGWITNVLLNWVITKGWIIIETKHEIHVKKENYAKVINNPQSTADQVADAFHDLLNK